jgi:hemerythrin-like domain-containing protein
MANDTNDKLNTLKGDSKDALDEVKNRAQATGERLKREVAGENMPLGERIVSNVKEALHNTKADYDSAKRDVRHDGDDLDKV